MKFIYTGHCASGFVQFTNPQAETVVMPHGEAVEVPGWLAKKLATNSHFAAVEEAEFDNLSFATAEQNESGKPPRGKPGPKPKPKPEDA